MKLKSIEIKNFRSIKEATIEFNHNCLILLGKNEAGKSNVLKAIAALYGEYIVTSKDKRKKVDNEKIDPNEYYVCAFYEFTKAEIDQTYKRFLEKYPGFDAITFENGTTLKTLLSVVLKNVLRIIEIDDKEAPYFSFISDDDTTYEIFSSNSSISTYSPQMGFDLEAALIETIEEIYSQSSTVCHFWKYSDDYLLPNSIDIKAFITNPQNHEPLRRLFLLCGRDDIKLEFENAKKEDGDYVNLLEQVSKQVTKTFQKIWNDFKGTSIQLIPDGPSILIKIADKAKYSCEDRSDGFKKFISILLMLSTQARSKRILENDLILIDEPDQSLYPTSANFLKNELLTIGEKSKIVYSTHSQYMIDTNNLERHIIVEKKDDVTTLTVENNVSPFTTDELLRRAIGASIFECIQPINIVFEGYLDKRLFEKYAEWQKKEDEFRGYGKIYLRGISGLDGVTSILDAANKRFVVVADSDSSSIAKRAEFEIEHPAYKTQWLAYADTVKGINTMEDFMKADYVSTEIKKHNIDFIYDSSKSTITNIEKASNKDKELKQLIKNELIANLTKEKIKEEYGQFLDGLKEKLDQMK